jgi:L-ascorbate metabolism protein UlaG (beta-lactamase superfamily)
MKSIKKFGKLPGKGRMGAIEKSPNYKNGSFRNINHTPDLTEGVGYYEVIREFIFASKEHTKPLRHIPSVKTDLLQLTPEEDVLVWFGHSSYFMQVDGRKMLVDPVLSGAASPLAFTTRAFEGTDRYTVADIPEIDYLFISHDHWDHLDYETIVQLAPKIKKVICGLGMGEHFQYWGYDKNIIIEQDWNEHFIPEPGFIIHTVPARHFSGRGLTRNKALWASYVVQTPASKIFIGGDSGYDTHFAEIGKKHGPFDLAILENGQYDKKWKYIHMMPEEVLQAALDLKARQLLPVHSAKFVLANHAWDEPLKRIAGLSAAFDIKLLTPKIGERVNLKETGQQFSYWWEDMG